MAFNGSGVFQRLYNWVNDLAALIPVTASRMDTEMDGMATGLSTCITKDGQTTITANLPMAGYRHTGVGNASASTDYAAYGQVQSNASTWGGTAGGTGNAITFNLTPAITAYAAGQIFRFISSAANTSTTTVAINGLTTKNVFKNGSALVGGEIQSGTVYEIIYDGTQFNLIGQGLGLLNMYDMIVQRPVLKDYGETLNAAGNITGATSVDYTSGNHYSGTLTGNVTFTFSNPPATGTTGILVLYLTQDGTGSRTVTWPASVIWPGGTAPTLTTTAGRTDVFTFITRDGGTKWAGITSGLNYNI